MPLDLVLRKTRHNSALVKSNVLFYLLSTKRNVQLTTRLRRARQYPTIYARTNRYKFSFILFGLTHCSDVILCMHGFPVCLFFQPFEAAKIQ